MLDADGRDPARFASLDTADLSLALGGAVAAPGADPGEAFGRCGPGTSWKWLGDVYTPACRAHDASVRGYLANGSSAFMAHARSLPLLPSAIGSYVRARLR
jgi:hypothetical protein